MVYGDIEYFELLTTNAQEWVQYFDSVPTEYDDRDIYALALSRTIDEIMSILLECLLDAINSAGIEDNEFRRPLLKDKLLQVFNNYDIIQVAGGTFFFDADTIAGDWNDFSDGITKARSQLPPGKALTPEQKSQFWRVAVYPSYSAQSGIGPDTMGDYEKEEGDLWSQTISFRQIAWGDKAPYWLILEYGNAENKLAYPHTEPSRFLSKATHRADALFKSAVREVEAESSNLLEDAAVEYANNPDSFSEYDVLRDFYASGERYYIYVTSTRRVGVALTSTFQTLRRTYG